MLVRPTRTAHARCDGDAEEGATKKQRPTDSETPLLLTTEFNYQYRLYGGVWISYKEPQDEKPRLTPVLMSGLLSPVGAPEIVEVNGLYLYNTKYLRDTQMDYDHLIPDEAIGVNVWVLSDNHVHVTGARPSSAWKGVPVVVNGDAKVRQPLACPSPVGLQASIPLPQVVHSRAACSCTDGGSRHWYRDDSHGPHVRQGPQRPR